MINRLLAEKENEEFHFACVWLLALATSTPVPCRAMVDHDTQAVVAAFDRLKSEGGVLKFAPGSTSSKAVEGRWTVEFCG